MEIVLSLVDVPLLLKFNLLEKRPLVVIETHFSIGRKLEIGKRLLLRVILMYHSVKLRSFCAYIVKSKT